MGLENAQTGPPYSRLLMPALNSYDQNWIVQFVRAKVVVLGLQYKDSSPKPRLLSKLLPSQFISDVFNLYYRKAEDLSVVTIGKENRRYFELLQKINNYFIKTATVGSQFNALIYCYYICQAVCNTVMTVNTPLWSSNLGQWTKEARPHYLRNIFELDQEEENTLKTNIDKYFQVAQNLIHSEGARMFQHRSFRQMHKLLEVSNFKEYIEHQSKLFYQLKRDSGLKAIINTVINKSSRISSTFSMKEHNFFDIKYPVYIKSPEFLHPRFRNMMLDYAGFNTLDLQHGALFNFYLDISSSMNDELDLTKTEGSERHLISSLEFAKVVVIRFMEDNLLQHLYTFADQIYDVFEDEICESDVMQISAYGNTSIDAAIEHQLHRKGFPSIIITDAINTIKMYSEQVLIIGTPGAKFMLKGAAEKFRENNQIWIFNNEGELMAC